MAKKKKAADPAMTLAQLSERYLDHMEKAGKSNGTIFSYGMELKSAQAELGADTLVASITKEQIAAFNECKRVTKLKSGKPKAQPSIDKTRRVLRLAFAWAAETGLVERSPYAAPSEPTPEPEPPAPPAKAPKPRKAKTPVVEPEPVIEAEIPAA